MSVQGAEIFTLLLKLKGRMNAIGIEACLSRVCLANHYRPTTGG